MRFGIVKAFLVCFGILVLSQIIPVDHNNPSITSKIQRPELVGDILQRSCNDCHSNETDWPWYSRIAPISWLVSHDVQEGRDHLNFFTWGDYSEREKSKLRKEIWEVVDEDERPPWVYLPAHPEARLSEEDKRVIRLWLGY